MICVSTSGNLLTRPMSRRELKNEEDKRERREKFPKKADTRPDENTFCNYAGRGVPVTNIKTRTLPRY